MANYTNLPDGWIEKYYYEVEAEIIKDPCISLETDRKLINIGDRKYCIGQLELCSVKDILFEHDLLKIAKKVLSKNTYYWFLNMPSISEGKNYFITDSKIMQAEIAKKLDVSFKDGIGVFNRVILRKELMHIFDNRMLSS